MKWQYLKNLTGSKKEDCDKQIKEFYLKHLKSLDSWNNGEPTAIYEDKANKCFCIKYKNGEWWHYRKDKNNNVVWW